MGLTFSFLRRWRDEFLGRLGLLYLTYFVPILDKEPGEDDETDDETGGVVEEMACRCRCRCAQKAIAR